MITITNVKAHDEDPLGLRTYEVRIKGELLAVFQHRRANGLAACLLEASKAVERKKWEDARSVLGIKP